MNKYEEAVLLLKNIVRMGGNIICSDVVVRELYDQGYTKQDIVSFLGPLKVIAKFVYATPDYVRKCKDLSKKRNIPIGDALHSLLARDSHAILVSRDHHFKLLSDIAQIRSPRALLDSKFSF